LKRAIADIYEKIQPEAGNLEELIQYGFNI